MCDVKLSEDSRRDVMSGTLDTYQTLTSKLSDSEDGQPKHAAWMRDSEGMWLGGHAESDQTGEMMD